MRHNAFHSTEGAALESLRHLQQRVRDVLGEGASVDAWPAGDRQVYVFTVPQTPLSSDVATRLQAWQRVQDTLDLTVTFASLFEPDSNFEVIVGFPESVRTTKRRIFRVGGPLAEIGTLRTADPVTKHGDVYVAAYDDWQSSDAS